MATMNVLIALALPALIAGTTFDLDGRTQSDLDAAINSLLRANAFTSFRTSGRCGPMYSNHGCDPSSIKTCCTPAGTCEVAVWTESQCIGDGFHDHADHAKCRGGEGYERPQLYDPAVEFGLGLGFPCAHRDVRADQTYKDPTHDASTYFDALINEGKKQTVELQSLLAVYKQRKIASALEVGRGAEEVGSSTKEGAAAIAKLTSLGKEAEEAASRLAEQKKNMGIETSHADFIDFVERSPAHLNALHAALGTEDEDLNKIMLGMRAPLCGDILLVVKSSTAKKKYVDRLRNILGTYGTFCAHRITALTDDADLPALKRVQSDFPNLNVEIVRDNTAFGAYHDASMGSESEGKVAQAKKNKALFQFYQRVAPSVPDTKSLWLCYVDDDMYVNIPSLQAELKTTSGWIGDTGINPYCGSYKWDYRVRYTIGGWCMDRPTADAIAAYTVDYAPEAYTDDVKFCCLVYEYFKSEKRQSVAPKNSNAWFSEYTVPIKSLGNTATLDKAPVRYWKKGHPHEMVMDLSHYDHTEQGEVVTAESMDVPLDLLSDVSVINPSQIKPWKTKLASRVGSTKPTDVWGNWHQLMLRVHAP